MKELIIISIIIIVVYYSISPIKKVYIQYFRTNTINKFKNMCEEIKINMVIEDYLKVGADKIDEGFIIKLDSNNIKLDSNNQLPIEKTIDGVNNIYQIDKHLSDEIIKLSKEGIIDEFYYYKKPFLPYEKIYIGFTTTLYSTLYTTYR